MKEYYHPSYWAKKGKTALYRFAFLLLGCVFLALTLICFFTDPYHIHLLFIQHSYFLKWLICTISLFLGIGSLILSFMMRLEYEVLHHLSHQFKKKLKQLHRQQRVNLGLMPISLIPIGESVNLKRAYNDNLLTIERFRHEVICEFYKISNRDDLGYSEKEKKYNQVLFQFDKNVNQLLASC